MRNSKILASLDNPAFCHCEEPYFGDEAISRISEEIASGEYALAMTGIMDL